MSKIKSNPKFEPTPGTPTAAPSHFPYDHKSLADIDRQLAEAMRERFERQP